MVTSPNLRVGPIRAERLGHLALEVERYLCERDAGWHDGWTDEFWFSGPICNTALADQWRKLLDVMDGPSDASPVPWTDGGADPDGLVEATPPHITFTEWEDTAGRGRLRQLGIQGEHVLFHARDSAWLDGWLGGRWAYHDHRDATIDNYLPAMAEAVRRGYTAVRFGKLVNWPLPTSGGGIIDYASGPLRDDFTDLYLAATCRYGVLSSSGPASLLALFRKPIALANVCPLLTAVKPAWTSNRLFIPKLYKDAGRTLTVSEIVTRGIDNISKSDELGEIEVVENTPAEIAALSREMDDRVADRWVPAPEDEALQARFWDQAGMPMGRCRVGAEFLRDHPELLDA